MSQAARVDRWLREAALPLWAEAGIDREGGGFAERLFLDGRPDLDAAKRVRVQARQLYVYAHAELLGMMPGAGEVAERGYRFLMRHAFPDGIGRGVVRTLSRGGAVLDPVRDTYDHAFVLFALSWFHRVTGRTDARTAVLELGDAIWALLRHPGGEGFVIDTAGGDTLHQNPHMHLFEAVLAALDATGDERFLHRAHELFGLFRRRLFDRQAGVLREFYDARWRPAPAEAGQVVEPGHHAEWVWLLRCYADRTGEPLCEEAFRLHDFVERHGRPGGGALLCDELRVDGSVAKTSTRSWPQTEAIKAEIALAGADSMASAVRTNAIVTELFDTFLDRPVRGGWIDWVDAAGAPLVGAIPASTFYHLFLGFSEYLRAASR